ncbi:hypothetical protein RUND412_005865 [Rhizina undulata]
MLKIHGFTPSELLLGFNIRLGALEPRVQHKIVIATLGQNWSEIISRELADQPEVERLLEKHNYTARLTRLDEIYEMESPKQGDFVLLQQLKLDSQHSGKLEPRRLRAVNTGKNVRVRAAGRKELSFR